MVEAKRPGTTDSSATLPADMAVAVNVFAHPFAGVAAASAVGVGLASHGFGLWLGTVAAFAEASQRMLSLYDQFGSDISSFKAKRSPATRAKSTAKVLIEDARSTALEIAGADSSAVAASKVQPVIPANVDSSVTLQPEDFRQPKSMPKPRKVDDLKAISGIGPKLEKVLNGLGVWTYGQIAGWTAEEVAWVEDYLSFKGRIGRDDWIGQAVALAVKKN